MQDSGCVLLGSLAVSLHTHMYVGTPNGAPVYKIEIQGSIALARIGCARRSYRREKFFLTTTYALGSWKLKKKDVWALDGDRGKRVGALGLTNLSPTALIIQRVAERCVA
ncbi:hypothetical protein CIHG_00667 [Coccidioides immitis H538.4]|uniref:Uncharacterized protein n=3 Tax=Coccidioides immitis TaxID=5501 RepID=A0A0J8QNK1_COCIT|nr:hypothetical protein CIRG_03086 [Coccidioides immitis RMSCC 2394]KMU73935.1 hypothetical protein CISG_03913 [Coccidioides immitis RMSCC 3703]KMU82884.1 hypothetical protein CIHG_00667 [Coccidioides immitis H538.4]